MEESIDKEKMKDCLVIGNKNAVTTKYVFPLLKDRVLKTGYTVPMDYTQPEWCETKTLNGLTRWFTTLPVTDKEPLVLTARYSPEKYPKYDNYEAIEVGALKDIPFDYSGVMGVPITILDKNLDRVEIVWRSGDIEWAENECGFFTPPAEERAKMYKEEDSTWRVQNPYLLNGDKASTVYNRVFIKVEGLLYGEYTEIDGEYIKGHRPMLNGEQKYSRVLIKKK